jgi:hypothetical protein
LELIGGSAKVIEMLGYWPCFHDGTLIALSLIEDIETPGLATIEMAAKVHRMLSEIDDRGFYKNTDHASIRLRFTGARVAMFEMQLFPSPIYGCGIVQSAEMQNCLQVNIGMEGSAQFSCKAASVEEFSLSPP